VQSIRHKLDVQRLKSDSGAHIRRAHSYANRCAVFGPGMWLLARAWGKQHVRIVPCRVLHCGAVSSLRRLSCAGTWQARTSCS